MTSFLLVLTKQIPGLFRGGDQGNKSTKTQTEKQRIQKVTNQTRPDVYGSPFFRS